MESIMTRNMKTIAITIDEPTLEHIDRLVAGGERRYKNRSQLIRQAVWE
jgi:Arc/MetJ-type ribon-helix-helix transcriptional regulator